MKRFRFPLEPLLNLRIFREREAQQKLSEAQEAVRACEIRRELLHQEIDATHDELDRELSEGVAAEAFQAYQSYLATLGTAFSHEGDMLRQCIEARDQRQSELARKSVEKKVLENLKQRRETEYYDELNKLAQKEIDDLVIVRKVREIQK